MFALIFSGDDDVMEGPAPAGGDVGSGRRVHDAVRSDSGDADAEHRHGRDRHRYSLPMQVGFVNP